MYGYLGLEIDASLDKHKDLKDHWSTKMCNGNDYFRNVMGRDGFLKIGALLHFYPLYTHIMAPVVGQLWYSRTNDGTFFQKLCLSRCFVGC